MAARCRRWAATRAAPLPLARGPLAQSGTASRCAVAGAHAPRPTTPSQAVLVDVGEHTGALVLHAAGRARGPRGGDPSRSQTRTGAPTCGCCRGRAGEATVYAAVFPSLAAGDYAVIAPDGSVSDRGRRSPPTRSRTPTGPERPLRALAATAPIVSRASFSSPSSWSESAVGQPVAELGEVLLDRGHLGSPLLGVDPQQLAHVLVGRRRAPRGRWRPERAGSRWASRRPRHARRSARRSTRARGRSRRSRARGSGRPRLLRNQLT